MNNGYLVQYYITLFHLEHTKTADSFEYIIASNTYGLQRSTASYFGSTRIVLSSIHGFQTNTILEQSNEQPSLFISSITKPFVISI